MTLAAQHKSESLEALVDAGPELDWSDWSLAPAALERVLAEVASGRERIVECGSGVSTIVIARLLRERGRGRVWALEDDPDWAARVRESIALEGLGGHAQVIEAPLRPDRLAQPGCEWYDRAALVELPARIELLIVDGPPARTEEPERARSRYPALPLLAGRLARGATVVLDDASRAGETWILERWERELGIRFERLAEGIAIGAMRSPLSRPRAALVRAGAPVGIAAAALAEAREWNRLRRRSDIRTATLQRIRDRAGYADLAYDVGRLYAALDNQETRIRQLSAATAVGASIEHATLAREPLVSVITPTRDRPEQLRRAIESVRAQTYGNWELIVVNDGTAGIAEPVEGASDERVRWIETETAGAAAARNRGLAAARGELIAYLDDDNTMHPGWLKAVAWGFEHRPDVDVLYGGWVIDQLGSAYGDDSPTLPGLILHPFDRETQLRQTLADTSALAHRAGLAEAYWDESLEALGDRDLLVRMTADADPLVLPVIADFYRTDAPDRISDSPSIDADRAAAGERIRRARSA